MGKERQESWGLDPLIHEASFKDPDEVRRLLKVRDGVSEKGLEAVRMDNARILGELAEKARHIHPVPKLDDESQLDDPGLRKTG